MTAVKTPFLLLGTFNARTMFDADSILLLLACVHFKISLPTSHRNEEARESRQTFGGWVHLQRVYPHITDRLRSSFCSTVVLGLHNSAACPSAASQWPF